MTSNIPQNTPLFPSQAPKPSTPAVSHTSAGSDLAAKNIRCVVDVVAEVI